MYTDECRERCTPMKIHSRSRYNHPHLSQPLSALICDEKRNYSTVFTDLLNRPLMKKAEDCDIISSRVKLQHCEGLGAFEEIKKKLVEQKECTYGRPFT